MKGLHQYETDVVYKPFLFDSEHKLHYLDSRDTLLKLASKKDITTVKALEKRHPVLDGASSTIIIARKIAGQYLIKSHHFLPIGLVPINGE